MPITFQSYNDIYKSIVATLQQVGSTLTDFNKGSGIGSLVQSFSAALSLRETRLVNLQDSFYIMTATGSDLDKRAADFGLIRKSGVLSTGFVTVSSTLTVTLPAGTIVETVDGLRKYVTVQPVAVSTEARSIAISAVTTGAALNLPGGSILTTTSTYSPYLTITVSPAGTSGGLAQETDTEFRDRFTNYLLSLARCTSLGVQNAALSVPGVTRIVYKDVTRVAGEFQIYVDNGDGTVNQDTVNAVAGAVGQAKGAGVSVVIKAVSRVTTPVVLDLIVLPLADQNLIVQQATAGIIDYINGLLPGETLYTGKIQAAALYSTSGILSATVILPSANIVVPDTSLVRASTINLSTTVFS